MSNLQLQHIKAYDKSVAPELHDQRFISGKLYEEQGFAGDLIDSYDNWLTRLMPHMLREYPCRLGSSGDIVRIEDVQIDRPSIESRDILDGPNTTRVSRPLLPKEAREKGITYAVRVRGTCVLYNSVGQLITRTENRVIGEIPCMLGSAYCHLRDMTPEQRLEVGECHNDPLGYFIIKDREFTMNIQSNLAYNLPILYLTKPPNKEERGVLRTTSLTPYGTFVSDVTITESRSMVIETFIGGIKIGLNPFQVMRLLWVPEMFGELDELTMIGLVLQTVEEKNRNRVRASISNTLSAYHQIGEDVGDIIGKRSVAFATAKRTGIHKDIDLKGIYADLDKFLFSHMNPSSYSGRTSSDSFTRGLYAQFLSGDVLPDDRNDWSVKQLSNVGIMFERLFLRVLKALYMPFETRTENATNSYSHFLINYQHVTVLDKFQSAFINNVWVVSANQRASLEDKNVVMEKDKNLLAHFSALTRINIPSSAKGGQMEVRGINLSQIRFVCIWETPEGDRAGLVMAKGSSAVISRQLDDSIIQNYMYGQVGYGVLAEIEPTLPNRKYKCMINGSFQGYIDYKEIVDYINEQRNYGMYLDVAINLDGDEFQITLGTEEEINAFITYLTGPIDGYGMSIFYMPELPERTMPCLLNGKFVGFCNGEELRYELLKRKRAGVFPYETGVAIHHGALIVTTMGGRLLCPTLVVGDGKHTLHGDKTVRDELVLDTLIKSKKITRDTKYSELVRWGVVEYIDPMEQGQERVLMAQTLDDFRFHRESIKRFKKMTNRSEHEEKVYQELLTKKYTYCEITPSSLMGVAAGIIPLPNTNQPARNTYQAAMGKQAQGIYHSNACNRLDREAKMLSYPAKPIFSTAISSKLGLDQMPSGETVTVAVMMTPGTQEDALEFKKSSIERGMFNSVVYRTHRKTLNVVGDPRDVLTNIPNEIKYKNNPHHYRHLGPDGLPRPGSQVTVGDCILGLKRIEKGAKDRDISEYITSDEAGIIEKVYIHKSSNTTTTIAIKIRTIRIPIVGDKFALRHAQKGTIGIITPDEDMPFDRNGITPDVIFNTHGIPSRMTIGMLIETIVSRVGAHSGRTFDASGFNGLNVDNFSSILTAYGFSKKGTQTMYDGKSGKIIGHEELSLQQRWETVAFDTRTGERAAFGTPLEFVERRQVMVDAEPVLRSNLIPCQVFVGPDYYQRLRHEVVEKCHQRGLEGRIDPVTQLPTGGSEGGALRLGEMERDALVSYGVAFGIRERFVTLADDYKFIACTTCGTEAAYESTCQIGDTTKGKLKCLKCGSNTFGRCHVPYGIFTFKRTLSGLNIGMVFKLEKVPEIQKVKK